MTLLIDVALPALILMQLSAPTRLGPLGALLLAVSVSAARIAWTVARERRVRPTTLLGLASVLMLGLVAILELPGAWIAIKEAMIPGLIALVLLVAHLAGRDLAARLLLTTLDEEHVRERVSLVNGEGTYKRLVRRSGAVVVGAFVVSAVVNFLVAWFVVTGEPGTVQFNEQIATTSVVSAIAAFVATGTMILAGEWYLLRGIARLTETPMMDLLRKAG